MAAKLGRTRLSFALPQTPIHRRSTRRLLWPRLSRAAMPRSVPARYRDGHVGAGDKRIAFLPDLGEVGGVLPYL